MEQQQFKGKMEWTGGSPAAYLVFLLSSYVLTGVLLLLLAFLLYQFQWSEKAVKIGSHRETLFTGPYTEPAHIKPSV